METGAAWLVGIDGGGTRGRFACADASGRILRAARTGPLNPSNSDAAEITATLRAGIAKLDLGPTVRRVHAGVAGIKTAADGDRYGELLAEAGGFSRDAVTAVNDIVPLLRGGLAGRPGIALILGTGSHAAGIGPDRRMLTCGGWGRLMDDAGSGYAIGLAALRRAVRMWDGRLAPTPFADRIRGFLGIEDPGEALHRVHGDDFGFAGINHLGREVIDWAEQGEPTAVELLGDALDDAAGLVITLASRLGLAAPEVVLAGGTAGHPLVRGMLASRLDDRLPGCRLREPDLPPLAGAILGAAADAGLAIDEPFLANIRGTLPLLDPVL